MKAIKEILKLQKAKTTLQKEVVVAVAGGDGTLMFLA